MTFICIALVWLTGFFFARFLFPAPPRWSLHNIFLFSLGAGLGIGIASCCYFLCLAVIGPSLAMLVFLAVIVAGAAMVLAWKTASGGGELEWAAGPPTPRYLTGFLFLAAAIAAAMFAIRSLNMPSGEWDAWSIWNLKALFLFRGGEFWKDAFSTQIPTSHPDFPLLVPAIVAMCWTLARGESIAVPIAIAFLFILGAAGLLISSTGILRGKTPAFLAGTVLLATSSFVQLGAMQYADVPLSFFILAALALLCLQDRFPDDSRFSMAAGLTAGFAPWTKNEGWLFLVALLLARLIAIRRFGKQPGSSRQFLRLAAAALPPVAIAAFFKLRLAPPNDWFAQKTTDLVAHITTFARWMFTIEGFVKMAMLFGGFLLPMALALGLYAFLVRFRVEERDRLPLATLVLTLGLTLLGEFGAYVLLPPDVVTQLNVSLERLFMQLWPSALLAFFLAANPPQLITLPAHADTKAKSGERSSKPGARSPRPKPRPAQPKPALPPVRLN